MILEKQLLLLFNLETVIRPLPNNLESIILQWETLITSENIKDDRQWMPSSF